MSKNLPSTEVKSIEFAGATISTWQDVNGKVYVGVKRICENIKIAHETQLRKLREDPVLQEHITSMTMMVTEKSHREVIGIDLDFLPMWLAKIDTRRVRSDESKRILLQYQSECAQALRAYWFDGVAVNPRAEPMQITSVRAYAADTLETEVRIASIFDLPKHLALTEAVKQTHELTGVDFTSYLIQSPHMNNIPGQDVFLQVSEIAKRLGISPRLINPALQEAGLQTKVGWDWIPSQYALEQVLCQRHAWKVRYKSGYNLKWRYSAIIEVLRDAGLVPDGYCGESTVVYGLEVH